MASLTRASTPYIEGRGEVFCRGCQKRNLFSALDLGLLPIANELLKSPTDKIERFPLHLRICPSCGLGQVADVTTPERIFRDYRYLSSISSTFVQHAEQYVDALIRQEFFTQNDWVLEIASNDGYLLKHFLSHGIKVLGIEPAENVALISSSLGIPTISEFFTSKLAETLLLNHGYPRLIIANNVMAHVPDLEDFMSGLALLCGPHTQLSIENPSIANILIEMQFDTIYHEHYSYLTAYSVKNLGNRHNLNLDRVEEIPIHGGSNRYWLSALTSESRSDSSVGKTISKELEQGLFTKENWIAYSGHVENILMQLRNWLIDTKRDMRTIYGYGAAAKASTILNSITIDEDLIIAIADASAEKQSRFMPPYGIRIISPEEMFKSQVTDVLIFPWNIKREIASLLKENLKSEVRIWCAIPNMHLVEA